MGEDAGLCGSGVVGGGSGCFPAVTTTPAELKIRSTALAGRRFELGRFVAAAISCATARSMLPCSAASAASISDREKRSLLERRQGIHLVVIVAEQAGFDEVGVGGCRAERRIELF